jgi:hypothetical protein
MEPDKISSLHKPGRELAYPESGLRQQVLLPENCFNPLIVSFRCGNKKSEIDVKEQNENFYYPLSALRRAIEARPLQLEAMLEALWIFYYDIFILADKRDFQDFLKFDGMFFGCSWFKNSNLKDFPQDLICLEENLPKKMKFDVFLEKGKRPKDMLKILFDGRQDKDTTEISTLKFKNPFSQILTGEFGFDGAQQAFDNAKECLNDDDFEALFRKGKGSKNKEQVVNERMVGEFEIADYAAFQPIPNGVQVIQSPVKNGAWGFANVMRGLRPDDRTHDYCKSIRTIAHKHLARTGEYLVHCDKAREEYWTLESNKTLFQSGTRGRKKRS